MRPGSLLRLWRYIKHLLTYLLTYFIINIIIIIITNIPRNPAYMTTVLNVTDRQTDRVTDISVAIRRSAKEHRAVKHCHCTQRKPISSKTARISNEWQVRCGRQWWPYCHLYISIVQAAEAGVIDDSCDFHIDFLQLLTRLVGEHTLKWACNKTIRSVCFST